jgi:hypothetical protein
MAMEKESLMSDEIKLLKLKLKLSELENSHLKKKLGDKEPETPWLGDVLENQFKKTIHSLSGRMDWDCNQAAAFCVELLQDVNHPAAGDVNYILSLRGD